MAARKPPISGNPGEGRHRAPARSKPDLNRFGLSEAFFAFRRPISPTSAHRSSFPPMAGSRDGVSTAPPVRRRGGGSVHAILPDRGDARSGRRDGCSPRPSPAPSSARSRRARRKEPCRAGGARDRYPRFHRRARAAHLRELRALSRTLSSSLNRPFFGNAAQSSSSSGRFRFSGLWKPQSKLA